MRLTHEGVERSVAEMWEALAGLPAADEDKQAVIDQAKTVEANLRLRLAEQDRLDQAAPILLAAARLVMAWDPEPVNPGAPRRLPATIREVLEQGLAAAGSQPEREAPPF